MKAAFYKGKGTVFNGFIRWWDAGAYSHVEIVFSDGLAASASFRDGQQVRTKQIDFNDGHWDFIELPDELEDQARAFLVKTDGMPYDLLGQIRFLIAPMKGQKSKFWCSEWVAAALGMDQPWRYGPNGLYAALHNRIKD
jgi:hypothetical protein